MAVAANQADSIFWQALDIASPKDREAYLERACDGDAQLRRLIAEMLAAYPRVGSFLEQPASGVDVASQQPAEHPGMQVGPYKLLEQIGEGGMGVVFMAQQLAPVKRKVALKLIKPGLDTKQVIARFEAERQALALMDHPNIARVLDAGTTGEGSRPYFVMELVRGISITEYCQQQKLDTRQRLELFVTVCRAVHHAHQKGIIHRDLKPSNVLVTLHDGVPVAKVIDFGVAKALHQDLTERTLFTQFAQMIGTPLYMSPEQAEMSGLDSDTRSDIYSLGVLLYELVTGTTPFDKDALTAGGFDEMRRIICEVEPETINARLAKTRSQNALLRAPSRQLPARGLTELGWIAAKAIEKDRNRRYESAASLADDVGRFLRDEPVLACPPSALYKCSKFVRRYRRLLTMLAIVGAACLASVAALSIAYVQVHQKQAETQAALDRERVTLNRERQTSYYNRIALADSSFWLANDVGQSERLLDACPEEFRHWEWNYLKRLCHTEEFSLRQPNQPVHSLAVSPDGQRVATGGTGSITIWDSRTGGKLANFRAHDRIVSGISFSPDGGQFVTCGDKAVKLWNAQTLAMVREYRGHQGLVQSVAFSPLGGIIASAGQDQTVRVWDATTGEQRFDLKGHTGPVRAVAFSADGKRLASAGDDTIVRIWDATTGVSEATLSGHTNYIASVAFDPTGNLVAASGADWTGRVWDIASGQEIRTLRGHKHYVHGIAFSPDGKSLATASYDQTVKLWDAVSGQELRTFRGHTHWVQHVAFCDDGKRLISAGYDQTAKIWNTTTSQEVHTIPVGTDVVHQAVFSPDGKRLATAGGDKTIRIWDFTTGQELLTLTGHDWQVWGVAFSPDGKTLASAGGRRGDPDPADVKIWDAATGSELHTLRGHTRTVRKVAFSPDGRRLASASHDNTVKLWDVATGSENRTLTGHTQEVVSVAFSPDGQRLASSSYDKTVKLWDVATGQLVRTFSGHNSRVYGVAFSPDGTRLASVGSALPSCVKIWDAATGQELQSLPVLTTPLNGLAYSPDGRRIATVSYDGSARIWDAATGAELLTLRGHTQPVWSAAFSPDGWRLATASYDGTVKIWDATPKQMTNDQEPMTNAVGRGSPNPVHYEHDPEGAPFVD